MASAGAQCNHVQHVSTQLPYALTAAGVSAVWRWVTVDVTCAYGLFERVKTAVLSLGGAVDGLDYGADVTMHILLPEEAVEDFSVQLGDLSAGSAEAAVTGEQMKAVPMEG